MLSPDLVFVSGKGAAEILRSGKLVQFLLRLGAFYLAYSLFLNGYSKLPANLTGYECRLVKTAAEGVPAVHRDGNYHIRALGSTFCAEPVRKCSAESIGGIAVGTVLQQYYRRLYAVIVVKCRGKADSSLNGEASLIDAELCCAVAAEAVHCAYKGSADGTPRGEENVEKPSLRNISHIITYGKSSVCGGAFLSEVHI